MVKYSRDTSFVSAKEAKPTGDCDFQARADEENKFERSERFMNGDATAYGSTKE